MYVCGSDKSLYSQYPYLSIIPFLKQHFKLLECFTMSGRRHDIVWLYFDKIKLLGKPGVVQNARNVERNCKDLLQE